MIRHDHNLSIPGNSEGRLVDFVRYDCRRTKHQNPGSDQSPNGRTPDSPRVNVLLTAYTEVRQIQGVLKTRRRQMSMAALIPGLATQAEAEY
jgi:hypothetical protein